MIDKDLERIVETEREKGHRPDYIKNTLKEYLQVILLFFVYTHPRYNKNLIFTGGTCLRHFFGLDRLSEDIDFDTIDAFDPALMIDDIRDFFSQKYKYVDLGSSLKQRGQQILLKFPILQKIGLADKSESDFLYVKMDLSPIPSPHYHLVTSAKSQYGFNYVAKHYDLPDLMAGKIHAVLKRSFLKGGEKSIKGRDYFDLLWFLQNRIKPNLSRLSDMLGESFTLEEIEQQLDKKVNSLSAHQNAFRSDLEPLLRNEESVKFYIEHYSENYFRERNRESSLPLKTK